MMNHRKLIFIALIYSLIGAGTYAQIAELTTIITDPNDQPANGMVLVNSNDSSWSKNLEDGSAYFILKNQTGIDNVLHPSDIIVFPNPIRNGELTVSVPFGLNDALIEFFGITGQHLGRIPLKAGNALSFQVKPGIILYRVVHNQETHIGRVVNLGDIVQVRISEGPEPMRPLKIASLQEDEYNILYSDTENDLEAAVVESVPIPVGSHRILYLYPDFSNKTSWIDFQTNTNTDIKIFTNVEIASIFSPGGTESLTIEERYSKTVGLDLYISLTGEYTDTANIELNLQPGQHYTI